MHIPRFSFAVAPAVKPEGVIVDHLQASNVAPLRWDFDTIALTLI